MAGRSPEEDPPLGIGYAWRRESLQARGRGRAKRRSGRSRRAEGPPEQPGTRPATTIRWGVLHDLMGQQNPALSPP